MECGTDHDDGTKHANPTFPASLRPIPYVSAAAGDSTLAGHLFYYGLVPRWKHDHPRDFRIYSHGHVPGTAIQMKILWTLSGSQTTHGLTVRGERAERLRIIHREFSRRHAVPVDHLAT